MCVSMLKLPTKFSGLREGEYNRGMWLVWRTSHVSHESPWWGGSWSRERLGPGRTPLPACGVRPLRWTAASAVGVSLRLMTRGGNQASTLHLDQRVIGTVPHSQSLWLGAWVSYAASVFSTPSPNTTPTPPPRSLTLSLSSLILFWLAFKVWETHLLRVLLVAQPLWYITAVRTWEQTEALFDLCAYVEMLAPLSFQCGQWIGTQNVYEGTRVLWRKVACL